jgi:hypothetical protein
LTPAAEIFLGIAAVGTGLGLFVIANTWHERIAWRRASLEARRQLDLDRALNPPGDPPGDPPGNPPG